jgi:hypothetical protein
LRGRVTTMTRDKRACVYRTDPLSDGWQAGSNSVTVAAGTIITDRPPQFTSFPVGLLHPLQHAGLARRTPACP